MAVCEQQQAERKIEMAEPENSIEVEVPGSITLQKKQSTEAAVAKTKKPQRRLSLVRFELEDSVMAMNGDCEVSVTSQNGNAEEKEKYGSEFPIEKVKPILHRREQTSLSNGSITKSSGNSLSIGTSRISAGHQSLFTAKSVDSGAVTSESTTGNKGSKPSPSVCSGSRRALHRHKSGREENSFLRYYDMFEDQQSRRSVDTRNDPNDSSQKKEEQDLDGATSIDDESSTSGENNYCLDNTSTASFGSLDAMPAFIEPTEVIAAWNVFYDMVGGDHFLLVESDTMMWTWKRFGQVFNETAIAYAKKACKKSPPSGYNRSKDSVDASIVSSRNTILAFKKAVASYRGGVMEGTLLHYVSRINPPNEIAKVLIEAYPKSLLTTDKEDYQPIQFVYSNLISTLCHKYAIVRQSLWDNFLDVFEAVRHTKFAKVVVMMKGGSNEDTLLHQVVIQEKVPLYVIEALLGDEDASNILVTQTNKHGSSPLHYAIQSKASLDTISLLLYSDKAKQTLSMHGQYGYSPLHLATHKGVSIDVVKLLLHSADDQSELVCSLDQNDETPLAHAVQKSASHDVINELIEADGNEVTLAMKDCFGRSPLCQAIKKGLPAETVEILVDHSPVELIEALIKKTIGCERKVDPSKGKSRALNREKRPFSMTSASFVSQKGGTVDVSVRYLGCLAKFVVTSHRCQDILNNRAADRIFTAVVMADFYVYILLILSFSVSTHLCIQGWMGLADMNQALHWYNSLYVLSAYLCMREVLQFATQGLNWLIDIWNWLDMLNVFLVATCASIMRNGDEVEWARQLFMVTGFIVWFMLLTFLKSSFLPFSVFITGVSNIIWKLIPFLASSSIVLGAFVHMYYTDAVGSDRCMGLLATSDSERINNGEDSKFCTYEGTLLKIFHMFVGGVDEYLLSNGAVEERNWLLDDHDMNYSTTGISILFGLLVQILLLNVIIVVVNESWDDVARHGAEVFWEHRINFLSEVRTVGLGSISSDAQSGVKHMMKGLDDCGTSLMKSVFWGNVPDETDLYEFMTSLQEEGFLMGLCVDWNDAHSERSRIVAVSRETIVFLRGLYNFAIFACFGVLSFVGGFFTFGVLWPRDFRYFLFGRNAVDDFDGTGQMSKEIHLIHERCDGFEENLRSALQLNRELQRQNKILKQKLDDSTAVTKRSTNNENELLKEAQRKSEINANATRLKIDSILRLMTEMRRDAARNGH